MRWNFRGERSVVLRLQGVKHGHRGVRLFDHVALAERAVCDPRGDTNLQLHHHLPVGALIRLE